MLNSEATRETSVSLSPLDNITESKYLKASDASFLIVSFILITPRMVSPRLTSIPSCPLPTEYDFPSIFHEKSIKNDEKTYVFFHIGGIYMWGCTAYILENINPDVLHATRAYSDRDGLRALSWFSILWCFGSISTTAMLSLTARMSLDSMGGAASEKVDVQLAVPVADASNNI